MVLVYRAEWWVCDKNIMLVTRVTRYNAIWQFLRFFGRRIPAAYGFACDQTINAMLWRVTHRAPVRTRRFDAQGRCHCSFASSSLAHIRAWMINARANGKCHPGTRIYRFSYTRVSFDRYMWFILRSDKRCARFRCNVFPCSPGFSISTPCHRFSQKYDATATRLFEDNDPVHLAFFLVCLTFVADFNVFTFFFLYLSFRSICPNKGHFLRSLFSNISIILGNE